jgi:hypothetical protein
MGQAYIITFFFYVENIFIVLYMSIKKCFPKKIN